MFWLLIIAQTQQDLKFKIPSFNLHSLQIRHCKW